MRYPIVITSFFIIIILIIGALFATGVFNAKKIQQYFSGKDVIENQSASSQGVVITPEQKAYQVALARAREWNADAALAFIDSSAKDKIETSSPVWEFTFAPKNNDTQKGFVVVIEGEKIIRVEEIQHSGSGADLPDNIISQEEAIARVKQMAGYENEPVLGVEAVYGAGNKVWYWGVKTGKGTASVEAKK